MFGFCPPPSRRESDGREWDFGKWATFCWRLWTEGSREQLCTESQHSAFSRTRRVIIEVIIEVVFWPLKPAAPRGSHSAPQCVVELLRDRIVCCFFLFWDLKCTHCTFIRLSACSQTRCQVNDILAKVQIYPNPNIPYRISWMLSFPFSPPLNKTLNIELFNLTGKIIERIAHSFSHGDEPWGL